MVDSLDFLSSLNSSKVGDGSSFFFIDSRVVVVIGIFILIESMGRGRRGGRGVEVELRCGKWVLMLSISMSVER